jgi:putative tricarboxylic transport membrane protein
VYSIVLAVGVFAACPGAAQPWTPSKTIEIVVSSGTGGAADRQARVVQKFLQGLPGMPVITVNNRPGGAGLIAWTSLGQHPGDAHYLATLNVALVTNQILGVSPLRYQDLTPLCILMREYIAVWVRAASAITSSHDLLARLKKDPTAVSFGFSPGRGNQNHIVLGMLARAAGVDPQALKLVIYSSGGQGTTAALAGHVEVWAGTLGGALPHAQSGAIRVLGVSATQRQPGRAAVLPTFREQGIDAAYYAFRGFVGAKGLTPEQIAFWDRAFAQVVQNEEWKKVQEENAWGDDFRGSADTREHLDAEHELLQRMLADLGVISR